MQIRCARAAKQLNLVEFMAQALFLKYAAKHRGSYLVKGRPVFIVSRLAAACRHIAVKLAQCADSRTPLMYFACPSGFGFAPHNVHGYSSASGRLSLHSVHPSHAFWLAPVSCFEARREPPPHRCESSFICI